VGGRGWQWSSAIDGNKVEDASVCRAQPDECYLLQAGADGGVAVVRSPAAYGLTHLARLMSWQSWPGPDDQQVRMHVWQREPANGWRAWDGTEGVGNADMANGRFPASL
jgi:hypothetical protein